MNLIIYKTFHLCLLDTEKRSHGLTVVFIFHFDKLSELVYLYLTCTQFFMELILLIVNEYFVPDFVD